jgi:DNA-binding transcriptional LysR family regulator
VNFPAGYRKILYMVDPSLLPPLLSLLTVARSGSVAAAARQRHLTPSAISQQIGRLERQLGVPLLERAGRGVRLTPAAEAALPAVQQLWADAEGLLAGLAEAAGRPLTTLRIAVSDYLGKALLAPVLRRLLDAGALLRFEIVTAHSRDAVALLGRGEVELAVVTGPEGGRGLEHRPLFEQPFAWVGPRRGRAVRTPLTERLRHEPILRLAPGSQGRGLLDAYLDRERIRPVSTIDVPSVSLMLSYVSGGLGIGLAPALALGEAAAGRVVSEPARVPPLPVTLVSRAGARRAPATEPFAALLEVEARRAGARVARLRRPA